MVYASRPSRPSAPRVVITLGLHGSASTWVFNVARELMVEALGDAAVLACFGGVGNEVVGERAVLGRHLVTKMHGTPNVDVFAYLTDARVLISVRDPRDAVASLVHRFGSEFEPCARAIAQDCRYALLCAEAGHPVLRYEDGFFEQPATVARIAGHLGLTVSGAAVARIFSAYRTEAVRAFAATVPSLPPERLASNGPDLQFDRVTQIHRTHIGDGRVGKWRERFSPEQRALLARLFAPFLEPFGYAAE